MLKEIKYIIYQKDIALSCKEYFQLEIKEDKNIVKYINEQFTNQKNKLITKQILDEQTIDFIDILYRIIKKWDKRYENNNALDGVVWKLLIKYRNDKTEYYSGKNDFPFNFEYIDKIIYELLKTEI